MNPFTRSATPGTGSRGDGFDAWDAYSLDHVPEPGPFLEDHEVLTGDDHLAFHRLTREVFEERGVYDATFGYNLARLNLDRRHPESGFRYAVEADDPSVLRAEFTPTTEFCPQADALITGSFRAWNGLEHRHEYDLVRVRVSPSHHQSVALNESLADLEERYLETGEVPDADGHETGASPSPDETTAESPF
ncbi:hypothetical protein [Haloterrigena alkaliphila]|uniref:DUF7998 domain-containing protein n=1 Tax=Haloterrigena alkaliphila TaxID=2816475 RepID=A0A8A2V9P7_9EURY|nr:hypothetical protein [Haloterrigena alkaliphila]QSW98759.1 hypothetical protein J0X25_15380 [Haloterrigena alkaliphila]